MNRDVHGLGRNYGLPVSWAAAGTLAMRAGTIQRLFRDMHAGIQHVTCAPPVFRTVGRELAGLAPQKKWVFLDLVDEG